LPVLPVLDIGAPDLRVCAERVPEDSISSVEVQQHIDSLVDTMRSVNGSGLAATQVGIHLQICVMEVTHNPRYPYKPSFPLTVMINPTWEPVGSDTYSNFEGCLSVPNLRGRVKRYRRIQVQYLDRKGVSHSKLLVGLRAGTVQHELDHLQGLLFTDRVEDKSSMTTWANFEAFHKENWLSEIAEVIQEEKELRTPSDS